MILKNSLILTLLTISLLHADFQPFIGMRNSYFGFVGMDIDNKWGLAIEHSIYPQGPEKQYIRGWVFANYAIWDKITIRYVTFAGQTYNDTYYDFGLQARANIQLITNYLQLLGVFQPYYDSFWKQQNGYLCSIQSMFTKEAGMFLSFKNLADYRDLERRYSAGLLFQVINLFVSPEYSIPLKKDFRAGRMTIFFKYYK